VRIVYVTLRCNTDKLDKNGPKKKYGDPMEWRLGVMILAIDGAAAIFADGINFTRAHRDMEPIAVTY